MLQKANFWNHLIKEIKKVYTGKLTYAANWDNYENVTFWKKLDYSGIDAYFPLSDAKTPSLQNCFIGWESHFKMIKNLSKEVNKPVIFTGSQLPIGDLRTDAKENLSTAIQIAATRENDLPKVGCLRIVLLKQEDLFQQY